MLAVVRASRAGTALTIVENTTSPDGRYAFACDDVPEVNGRHLWLVRLPALTPVGSPVPEDDFLGKPSDGQTLWNPSRHRVALVQAGHTWARTRVFDYSSKSLHEIPLPDLKSLPDKRLTGATKTTRVYVSATRWLGKSRLEFSVWGIAVYGAGKDEADFREFDLQAIVALGDGGTARTVRVEGGTIPNGR